VEELAPLLLQLDQRLQLEFEVQLACVEDSRVTKVGSKESMESIQEVQAIQVVLSLTLMMNDMKILRG